MSLHHAFMDTIYNLDASCRSGKKQGPAFMHTFFALLHVMCYELSMLSSCVLISEPILLHVNICLGRRTPEHACRLTLFTNTTNSRVQMQALCENSTHQAISKRCMQRSPIYTIFQSRTSVTRHNRHSSRRS